MNSRPKIIIQLLKIGASLSVLLFAMICIMSFPSLLREPLVLKVQNKYKSGNSFVIEGITDNGGRITAEYSESFFNKAQIGDTIRFNSSYRLLVKNEHTASIYIQERVWFLPPMILSSLFPLLIFFPDSRMLKRKFAYWLIGASELVNIFFLSTFFAPL